MSPTTRCRSNAFSMQRPCPQSPASASRRGPPKLSVVIPEITRNANAPRLTIVERCPPSPRTYAPVPLPCSPTSATSSSSSGSSSSSPSSISPEDQRTARSKMVAGILLNRHSPKPCPMAGALRAATHAANGCRKNYVSTPLRVEVC